MTSLAETRRLFGPKNRPHLDTNVRHRALLRKPLEIFPQDELDRIFGTTTGLRAVMGGRYSETQFGKIEKNFVRNGHLVSKETAPLEPEVLHALQAYRVGWESHYMKNGHQYVIRGAGNRQAFQDAEQAWHDFVVAYLARQGRTRPNWALEPLPGLDRVRITPPPPPPARARAALLPAVAAVTPARRPFSALATPPASRSSPTPAPRPAQSGSCLRRHSTPAQPPVASGSRLRPLVNDQAKRHPLKRKFLGIIDISDDEEEPACKKPRKYVGFIDLTRE
ncbi:hypothetical protein C8R43DRAFT_945257 [Mycena crocata]|nr:hypothetical protein C8R43DRAFT_945257 [Mycena crocata]